MSSKSLTIKELSSRVDDLSKTLHTDLTKFKEEMVNNNQNSSVYKEILNEHFIKRFEEFEMKVNDEIRKIKRDLDLISNNNQKSIDEVEKHSQQNNNRKILIHGITESNENIFNSVIKILAEKMNIQLDKKDFSCCYRIGRKSDAKKRPVLIEFIHQWQRDMVFYNKTKMKGSNLLITEVLTKTVYSWFQECFKKFKHNCWTSYGKVVIIIDGKKKYITNETELNKVLSLKVIK